MGKLGRLKPLVETMTQRVRKHSEVRDETVSWRKWYKLARWRKLRFDVLTEARFTCARCGWQDSRMIEMHSAFAAIGSWDIKLLKAPNLVCDHRQPHRGDPALFWYRDNLNCLCKACHDGAKQREERRQY